MVSRWVLLPPLRRVVVVEYLKAGVVGHGHAGGTESIPDRREGTHPRQRQPAADEGAVQMPRMLGDQIRKAAEPGELTYGLGSGRPMASIRPRLAAMAGVANVYPGHRAAARRR